MNHRKGLCLLQEMPLFLCLLFPEVFAVAVVVLVPENDAEQGPGHKTATKNRQAGAGNIHTAFPQQFKDQRKQGNTCPKNQS